MRNFIDRFGNISDLDNPESFDYLPNSITELRNIMFQEIGMYYCYVNFWHNGLFDNQKIRVEKLIKDFTDNEQENYKNVLWYKEQIFLFQEETENMC